MAVIQGRVRDLGGFKVRRVLPAIGHKHVGPFVFFDHMGPAVLSPEENMDVRPHPHINLATVTYLFEGVIEHRDSLGSLQLIEAGAINWMTAGRGIVHSERTPEALRHLPSAMNGIQLWVALPKDKEEIDPSFSHHAKDSLPRIKGKGFHGKVLLGEGFGVKSPVPVLSKMIYAEVWLEEGETLHIPAEGRELAAYLVEGRLWFEGNEIQAFDMAIADGDLTIRALKSSHFMILGGEYLGERYIEWNFVTSDKTRLEEVKKDWEKGPRLSSERFLPIPGDDKEFIPLPGRA